LRSYLRAYFDRLGAIPSRDEFKLDLIDGFAGGGTFLDEGKIVSGSPLVMLEESEAAKDRLQRGRSKFLHFDFKFYFVDVEAPHTDHLRKVLAKQGYTADGKHILVRNCPFEDSVEDIIAEVRRRQPRAGRAIFLLDQCGFSQVTFAHIAEIFRQLPTAEVILTFAADSLINFLAATPSIVQASAPIELSETRILELIELRNRDGRRALVQRVIREHIRTATGATYDTPFFIRPRTSRRALWFLHLSRHPTARDVMIQCHWNALNTFEHYGPGDFGMLGWDALNSGTLTLFNFEELEAEQLRTQLLDSMPAELFTLAADTPITVDTMRHMFANRTAAQFSDLDLVVLELAKEKEIDILDVDGKLRSRTLRRLRQTDRIAIPQTLLLPGFSRRR